jgi:hypothetical protein
MLLSVTVLLSGLAIAQQPLQSWSQMKEDLSAGTRQTSGATGPEVFQGQIASMAGSASGIPVAAGNTGTETQSGDTRTAAEKKEDRRREDAACGKGKANKGWVDTKGNKHHCNE